MEPKVAVYIVIRN